MPAPLRRGKPHARVCEQKPFHHTSPPLCLFLCNPPVPRCRWASARLRRAGAAIKLRGLPPYSVPQQCPALGGKVCVLRYQRPVQVTLPCFSRAMKPFPSSRANRATTVVAAHSYASAPRPAPAA